MRPVEFVLWLNGAAELVGDQPPTPEQWATMREKLGDAVGGLVAARLFERSEETLRADERRRELANDLLVSIISEVPKPHTPGLLNRILGKSTT